MVYVLLGTGFEETEAIVPVDLLRRAGIPVMTVGINGKTVYGGHNIGIEADILLDEMDLSNMDMIVLPGGLGGVPPSAEVNKLWMLCVMLGKMESTQLQSVPPPPFWQSSASPTDAMPPAIPAVKPIWATRLFPGILPVCRMEISLPALLPAVPYLSVLR